MGVNHILKRKQGMFFVLIVLGIVAFFTINATHSNSETKSFIDKLKDGDRIRYLVIGDSIGRGSGAETPQLTWFTQLEKKFEENFGSKMNGQYIVQSGATSFEGIYKLQQTQVSTDIDLLFIVFGENDRKYMLNEDFAELYENLIRQSKIRAPYAKVITIIESSLPNDGFAQTIKEVSEYYGAVPIDMRTVFKNSSLPVEKLTKDLIHPNGKGYELYANEIFNILTKLDQPKDKQSLPQARWMQTDFQLKANKQYQQNRGFHKVGKYFESNTNSHKLVYQFNGSMVGAILLRGPEGGLADIYIDNQFHSTISTWWPFQRERYIYLANNLGEGIHELSIVPTGSYSTNSTTNETYIRVSGIIEKETNFKY